jgi:micrococcal nuclease
MGILDNLYHYGFEVTRIVDGDTIEGIRDNGNKNFDKDVKVRLLGINTPEIRGAKSLTEKNAGERAKEYLASLILGKRVVIKTRKAKDDDSFARVLADVYLTDGTDIHVNELMLINGHAVVYEG